MGKIKFKTIWEGTVKSILDVIKISSLEKNKDKKWMEKWNVLKLLEVKGDQPSRIKIPAVHAA
jgi:hypothetical protein